MSTPIKLNEKLKYFDGDSTTNISIYASICASDGTSCMETYLPICVDGANTGYCQSSTYLAAEQASGLRYHDGVDIFAVLKTFVYPVPAPPSGGDIGVFGGGSGDKDRYDYITISSTGNATYFGDLYFARSQDTGVSNGANDRGVFGGTSTYAPIMEYITISSTGNGSVFGNLLTGKGALAACSNGTNERGVFGGGYNGSTYTNDIEYITISTLFSINTFGDLTGGRSQLSALSNATNERGVWGGGATAGGVRWNRIDYVNISSTGNAADFGDLTVARGWISAASNGTNERGVFAGGNITGGARSNIIDYITITSTGTCTNYGDLVDDTYQQAGTSNGTNERGVFGGGLPLAGGYGGIEYITINTTMNAIDFGDLTAGRYELAACSNA